MTRVIQERHGRVLKLINNDPAKRNAFGLDFYDGMIPAIEAAGQDDDIGAIVICGAEGFFCAGGDVSRLAKAHTFDFAGRREGVDKLHFYTLNTPELTRDICHAIGVTPEVKLQNVA